MQQRQRKCYNLRKKPEARGEVFVNIKHWMDIFLSPKSGKETEAQNYI